MEKFDRNEIEEKVKEILKDIMLVEATNLGMETTNYDIEKISDETRLAAEVGLSSLDLVEMVLGLESEFNIEVPDEKIGKFKTFSDVVNFVGQALESEPEELGK